jgi:ABC-type glycerol-3-phosphate transport system substrate-binding protein
MKFKTALLSASLALGTGFAAMSAQAAEIKVFVPPVMAQGGVPDLAKAFTAKTGVKVTVTTQPWAGR